jgi:hypothetical protein
MSESVPARDCRRYGPRHLHAAGGGRQQGENPRHRSRPGPPARRISRAAPGGRRRGGRAAGDPLSGDVVVLAVWYDGAQSAIEQYSTSSTARSSISPIRSTSRPFDGLVTPPRQLRRRGARRKGAPGGEAGEGLQHNLRRDAGRGPGWRGSRSTSSSRATTTRQADGRRVGPRRRPQPDRRGAATARSGARAPRLPSHGAPGGAEAAPHLQGLRE